MTYTPKTYEQAQTAIESIEQQIEEIRQAVFDNDYPDHVLVGIKRVHDDLIAQRDEIAERMVDLPTDADLRAQREQENEWNMYEQIRNDPYGGDDFALYNSGDCW